MSKNYYPNLNFTAQNPSNFQRANTNSLQSLQNSNPLNKYDIPPLAMAIIKHDYQEVENLLKGGANPNQAFHTPHDAFGYPEGVNTKDILQTVKPSTTPLMTAVSLGNEKIVESLISRGANVEAQDNDGYTPLMFATTGGYLNIVQLLLDQGAKLRTTNKLGESVVHLAAKCDHPHLLRKFIFNKSDINAVATSEPFKGATPLIYLTKLLTLNKHCLESIQILLNAKADINHEDTEGITALAYAMKNTHKDIVTSLIKAGADLNWHNKAGEDYLSIAIQTTQPYLVKMLLENKDVQVEDKHIRQLDSQQIHHEPMNLGGSYDYLEVPAGNISVNYLEQIRDIIETRLKLQQACDYYTEKEEDPAQEVGTITATSIEAEETSLSGESSEF